jgi:release factor glutamine methyltransferase
MIYRELLEEGKRTLKEAGITDAAIDAGILFEHVTGLGRGALIVRGEEEASERETDTYSLLLEKRSARVPVQHITGRADFMGLEFYVDRNVLIPRLDTEFLVEEMMREVGDGSSVLDVCTGSGCILISLMRYKNDVDGTGTDISEAALEIARKNESLVFNTRTEKSSEGCGLHNSIKWIRSDMFEAVTGEFDYIVSNPPYIRTDVIDTLMSEVRDHDPMQALDGGADGLRFYRIIAEEAGAHLKRGGKLFLEIGYDQGEDVTGLLERQGFRDIKILKDYSGNERVVICSKT